MDLENYFPELGAGAYRVTSPETPSYNCVAWAAGDETAWWEPDPNYQYYWPPGLPRVFSVEAYIEAYRALGYVSCEAEHEEPGFEKVAIFADSQGRPTHVARQLPTGVWTSKLGQLQDIEHNRLPAVAGAHYGSPVAYLRRKTERT